MDTIVRKPKQQRSRATLQKLVEAGIELLQERGYEGLSIGDVSARAGVSVGSIYQRFDSKEALFAALHEAFLERIDAEQRDLFSDIDPGLPDDRLIAEAVTRLAKMLQRHEHLLRVMILRGAVDEPTRQRGSRSSVVLAETFEGFLLTSVRGFRHENSEVAATICFRIVYATLTRRITSGPNFESATGISWELLTQEVARACASYLLSPSPR